MSLNMHSKPIDIDLFIYIGTSFLYHTMCFVLKLRRIIQPHYSVHFFKRITQKITNNTDFHLIK